MRRLLMAAMAITIALASVGQEHPWRIQFSQQFVGTGSNRESFRNSTGNNFNLRVSRSLMLSHNCGLRIGAGAFIENRKVHAFDTSMFCIDIFLVQWSHSYKSTTIEHFARLYGPEASFMFEYYCRNPKITFLAGTTLRYYADGRVRTLAKDPLPPGYVAPHAVGRLGMYSRSDMILELGMNIDIRRFDVGMSVAQGLLNQFGRSEGQVRIDASQFSVWVGYSF